MTTTSTLPTQRVNFSATLEPDADLDGFGDETQDNCTGTRTPPQADFDANGRGDACDLPGAPASRPRSSAPPVRIGSREHAGAT